LLDDNIFS